MSLPPILSRNGDWEGNELWQSSADWIAPALCLQYIPHVIRRGDAGEEALPSLRHSTSAEQQRRDTFYEVAKPRLEKLFPPPPSSAQLSQTQNHHIISALAAFQYRPEVSISHLLWEPGRSSYRLCLWVFTAISFLKATLCISSPPSRALGKYRSSPNLHSRNEEEKCLSWHPKDLLRWARVMALVLYPPGESQSLSGPRATQQRWLPCPCHRRSCQRYKGSPRGSEGRPGEAAEVGQDAMYMQPGKAAASTACWKQVMPPWRICPVTPEQLLSSSRKHGCLLHRGREISPAEQETINC